MWAIPIMWHSSPTAKTWCWRRSGLRLKMHEVFPVEHVQIASVRGDGTLRLRTWERACHKACGTGQAVAAAYLNQEVQGQTR